ncbi:peptidase domain-containing ABC transporter [Blastochloris sulfoviridis]|uniref:ATP-binding cassette domain-containing protein n=1 Tax=Blastochloris sulfoviridis TaxID=50712 RepID=A0A5M6HSU9_9HYPH|nr:ATP-binding cassette domain-containing protein [Blastochloris sulfoviridis]KAA5599002.1 ATP-binding cassette domain-containing protein [Blastochloris sulfoviridis]
MTDGPRKPLDETALQALRPRAPAEGDHAVHASMARLERAFAPPDAAPVAPTPAATPTADGGTGGDPVDEIEAIVAPATAAEACLAPLLAALGWAGDARTVREALPYFERVADIEDLRSVLARLGFASNARRLKAGRLHDDMLPALLESDTGALSVIIDRNADGTLAVFEGDSRESRNVGPAALKGTLFPVCRLSADESDATQTQKNWFGTVISHFKPAIAGAIALSFLINVAALAVPFFVIQIYDFGIGTRSADIVFLLAAGTGIVLATDLALRYIRARMIAYFGARIDALSAMAAFSQLLQMPISMVETAPIGTQVARLRQFETLRDTFTGALVTAIIDIPFVVVFLIAIAIWGGHLVWVPASLLVVFALMSAVTLPLLKHRTNAAGDVRQRLQLLLREILGKRQAIRDLNAESIWIARHRDLLVEWARKNRRLQFLNSVLQNLAQALASLAGVATLLFGTLSVMNGTMSPGALVGAMALVWRVMSPLQTTFLFSSRLEQALQTYQQLNRLMTIKGEHAPLGTRSFRREFGGQLTLNRLVFRYPRRTEPALRGVQLQVKPGEVIAITGPSGAGKSTLLKLILGLYPPLGGAVLVDGLDLRQIPAADWRSAVAYLPPKPHFFYGTIAQNLRLAQPDATDAEIVAALAAAGVDVSHPLLPEGIETRLTSNRLEQLSEPMKQGIGLARCFVKTAPVYLLDNPAASMDSAAAAAFMARISALKGTATVIMVTFRPAFMRLANRVVVLNEGLIIADGPPDKIIDKLAA